MVLIEPRLEKVVEGCHFEEGHERQLLDWALEDCNVITFIWEASRVVQSSLRTLPSCIVLNLPNAVVFDLQSHSQHVPKLLLQVLVLHLVPAISNRAPQLHDTSRIISLNVFVSNLLHLTLVALDVVVVLEAEVPLVHILSDAAGLERADA